MFIKKYIGMPLLFSACLFITNPLQATAQTKNSPSYSIYTSVINAYEKGWGSLSSKQIKGMELYDVWGLTFTQLVDLNNDGILELILVRMDEETSNSGASAQEESKVLQVFTLKEGKELQHVGALPLIQDGLSPSVTLATVDNKTYIVTGNAADATYWQKIFWEFTPKGFTRAIDFIAGSSNQGGEQRVINEKHTDVATFDPIYKKWTQTMQAMPLTNCTLQQVENIKAHTAKELQKLASYPIMDSADQTAIFKQGRFLIFEDMPKTAQEKILADYFQSFTKSNYTALQDIIVPISDPLWSLSVEDIRENIATKRYIPGYIIEKMNTIPAAEAGHQTVLLLENAAPVLKENSLQEYVFVRAIVHEVADAAHTSFSPQVGYGTYNFWGLIGKATAQSPWKLYAMFTDHILYPHMHANPFAVKFLSYTGNWQGMPDLSSYFSEEELKTIQHQDFGGNEMYVVRNKFNATTQVYALALNDDGKLETGRLLHTYKPGEVMFFTCNMSDLFPNIVLRYTTPYGAVLDYSPGLSLKDGEVLYDYYGEELEPKETRQDFRRVF